MAKYDKLNDELVHRFPLLRSRYEEETKLWEGEVPGPHVVFGDIFNPYLIQLLEENSDELQQAFDFIEELATDSDEKIREVVRVTICERILDTPDALRKAAPYIRPVTREVIEEIARDWGLSV